jgi:23S rRNA (uridine2552-2'-O)-methyltransferase
MGKRKRPDHWSRKAKAEGYAARSVFKLEEAQLRFRVLSPGQRVLDLGCSPGSWSGYARKLIGRRGALVGVDLVAVADYPGTQLVGSILEISPAELAEALGGAPHVVLSDMAPFTTGHRLTDHVRQLELATAARDVAVSVLRAGGSFVVKVFDGEDAQAFVQETRAHFSTVKRMKPKATRGESVEFFLVCSGFSPPQSTE